MSRLKKEDQKREYTAQKTDRELNRALDGAPTSCQLGQPGHDEYTLLLIYLNRAGSGVLAFPAV